MNSIEMKKSTYIRNGRMNLFNEQAFDADEIYHQ